MSKEAMKLALEALDMMIAPRSFQAQVRIKEIYETLKAELAKQEQGEPVSCLHRLVDVTNPVVKSGYMCMDCGAVFRAYTTPQQRKLLTGEQAAQILEAEHCWLSNETALRIARAIEAAHGIGVNK